MKNEIIIIYIKSIILSLFFISIFSQLQSSIWHFAGGVDQLVINSSQQKIVDDTSIIFEGDVEIIIGNRMHVWADIVHFDKKNKLLRAKKKGLGSIKIEDRSFLILADELYLDFVNKTGSADNIRIHVEEGFVSAKKAERLGEFEWELSKMVFTACDGESPHWSLKARKASLHGGYFIRIADVIFKIGRLPIFYLPKMALPIQSNTRSGFLIPKFSLDYNKGFGVKQEYYMKFGDRCDSTIGVDWQRKKGIVFSNEFRWGRASKCFTHSNMQYAIVHDSFVQRAGKIEKETKHRYWISSKDFQSVDNVFGGDLHTLTFVDFGTDKKIGYQFFNSIQNVDDAFYNALIVRSCRPFNQVEVRVDNTNTSRKRFSDLTRQDRQDVSQIVQDLTLLGYSVPPEASSVWQKKMLENKVSISQVPHLEWNFSSLFKGGDFYCHHNVGFDQVFLREEENEQLYIHSFLAQEEKIIPLTVADMVRLNSKIVGGCFWHWKGHSFNMEIAPILQVRSATKDRVSQKQVLERSLFAKGAGRLFVELGAEWALPENSISAREGRYVHIFQPTAAWRYTPRFNQGHWYHIDHWDKFFPQNMVSLGIRNNWFINDVDVHLHAKQGYDFFDRNNIHPLYRGGRHSHILPFTVEAGIGSTGVFLEAEQEYDLSRGRILQSLLQTRCAIKGINISMGYLFQHDRVIKERGLLSNVPHFVFLDTRFPLGKHLSIGYGGHFYSETGKHIFGFTGIKPLLHSVRFEYHGHCWGFYIGYEEKRYREFGNNKHERAIVFSLRLDTLGSFAKRFKRPEIIQEPVGELNDD